MPKQFIELSGKPIIMHTIEAFNEVLPESEKIIVLPESYFSYWSQLIKKFNFNIIHTLQKGGEIRFESVKNAVSLLKDDGIVAIHDAVRPFVSKEVIVSCFDIAEKYGSAIPVISIKDSVRMIENDKSISQKRDCLKAVQTPQCFRTDIIIDSYTQDYNSSFTDDASVVEAMGINIWLVEGNEENIKITTPFDLLIAESIIKKRVRKN